MVCYYKLVCKMINESMSSQHYGSIRRSSKFNDPADFQSFDPKDNLSESEASFRSFERPSITQTPAVKRQSANYQDPSLLNLDIRKLQKGDDYIHLQLSQRDGPSQSMKKDRSQQLLGIQSEREILNVINDDHY